VARVSVLFGGPSPEHDISILTGLQACHVLSHAGHDVLSLYWTKTGDWYSVEPTLEADAFINGVPHKSRQVLLSTEATKGFVEKRALGRVHPLEFDVAVNCCHGGPGENGALQSCLDLAGIRYTGPTARGAALGMDKLAFGGLVATAGLPTLPRVALLENGPMPEFPTPWIIKPRFGGSSIGIHVVDDTETAQKLLVSSPPLRAGAIIEPYLVDAIDLNISIRGYGDPTLSEVERPIREAKTDIYTYRDKYLREEGLAGAPRELPAALSGGMRDCIRSYASVIAQLAQVRGVARLDFLLHKEHIWINEINAIPGAMAFYLWRASGVSHEALLDDMLEEASKYPSYEPDTTGADGLALRNASAIASKLA
jgi:D-alanine-D-alanine ligase